MSAVEITFTLKGDAGDLPATLQRFFEQAACACAAPAPGIEPGPQPDLGTKMRASGLSSLRASGTPPTETETPGILLKAIRDDHGHTQKQMAARIGENQTCVSKLEAGRLVLTPGLAQKVIDAYRLDEPTAEKLRRAARAPKAGPATKGIKIGPHVIVHFSADWEEAITKALETLDGNAIREGGNFRLEGGQVISPRTLIAMANKILRTYGEELIDMPSGAP